MASSTTRTKAGPLRAITAVPSVIGIDLMVFSSTSKPIVCA